MNVSKRGDEQLKVEEENANERMKTTESGHIDHRSVSGAAVPKGS